MSFTVFLMLNPAHNVSSELTKSRTILKRIGHIMLRRVWLPKPLYNALPMIYICLGIYATYAALFMTHWSWVVPYFLLLACGCLHAGIYTATLRIRAYRRYRRRQQESRHCPSEPADSVRQ